MIRLAADTPIMIETITASLFVAFNREAINIPPKITTKRKRIMAPISFILHKFIIEEYSKSTKVKLNRLWH